MLGWSLPKSQVNVAIPRAARQGSPDAPDDTNESRGAWTGLQFLALLFHHLFISQIIKAKYRLFGWGKKSAVAAPTTGGSFFKL